MSDDLVTRLDDFRLNFEEIKDKWEEEDIFGMLAKIADCIELYGDRIKNLEASLLKIRLLSEARSRHAWDDHATYCRISTAALDGKVSEDV